MSRRRERVNVAPLILFGGALLFCVLTEAISSLST